MDGGNDGWMLELINAWKDRQMERKRPTSQFPPNLIQQEEHLS